MKLTFQSFAGPIRGSVSIPGDKSMAHRAALFAALADGRSEVGNFPDSGVTRAMLGALKTLGIDSSLSNGVLTLDGNGWRPFPKQGVAAYCGNSATTLRLLAGAIAGTGSSAVLDGSEGLRRRPMSRIIAPLRKMGVDVCGIDAHAPVSINMSGFPNGGRPRRPETIDYDLEEASAQVLSCLELAALGAKSECRFTPPGPVRDHTDRMLGAMGADIRVECDDRLVAPLVAEDGTTTNLRPLRGILPGDMSSAAFVLAAAAIVPGSRVTVRNVGVNPTRTGFLDILRAMGARIEIGDERESMGEPVADVTLEHAPLHGVKVDDADLVVRTIDEFPVLAAVAAFADGRTEVRNARELRWKETDRIRAIVSKFAALGVEVEECDDGFSIVGGSMKGGMVDAGGDHRMAMSAAVCSLRLPVEVEGAEIMNESFPTFVDTIAALAGGESARAE